MPSLFMLSATVALLAAPPPPEGTEETPSAEAAKVTDKNDPNYIRCRREPVIGSLAKKRKVCLTNRQWAEVAREGNDVARRVVEDGRAGMIGN